MVTTHLPRWFCIIVQSYISLCNLVIAQGVINISATWCCTIECITLHKLQDVILFLAHKLRAAHPQKIATRWFSFPSLQKGLDASPGNSVSKRRKYCWLVPTTNHKGRGSSENISSYNRKMLKLWSASCCLGRFQNTRAHYCAGSRQKVLSVTTRVSLTVCDCLCLCVCLTIQIHYQIGSCQTVCDHIGTLLCNE